MSTSSTVRTGLEVLIRDRRELLRGQRVGLLSHPGAVLPDLTAAVDALLAAGVQVSALFGPEHGFEAAVADGVPVADAVHPRTGLPIYSLYGATKVPTPAMLAGLDVLLFDVQDVGARYYTFIGSLVYLLQGAARAGLPAIVLDRPNPIDGLTVEGPPVAPGLESFVGMLPIPIRHGLTLGEVARYANAEQGIGADLTVIEMQGWRRGMWFDDTGLPWVPTSPNMPHLTAATLYPGTCLIEGTNLSEGRGTALPFELCGAPWLDGYRLAEALNALDLAGARFRPAHFAPTASKHAGQVCGGVQLHITDRQALRPVAAGLHLIAACRAQDPQRFEFLPSSWEGHPPHFDLLAGSPRVRAGLEAGVPPEELAAEAGASEWRQATGRACWLYGE